MFKKSIVRKLLQLLILTNFLSLHRKKPYFFGIRMVQKDENPPCCPQIRPIENFFGILKQRVYAKNWKAENRAQLENKIRRVIKNIKDQEPEIFQNLFLNLKQKIVYAEENSLQTLTN